MADYDFRSTQGTQIERLQNLVATTADRGELSFNWIKPIVDQTLDEYVTAHHNDDITKIPYPFPAASNISEASRLIDICLVQQREIHQLEAQGIMAALDICLARDTLEDNAAIEAAHLSASLAQAGTDKGEQDNLTKKINTHRWAIDERLRLHNRTGSALNYGERVSFLRKIYTQNMYDAWTYMMAGWRGLNLGYGLILPQPNEWDHTIENYVKWIHRAVEYMERGRNEEIIYDAILYLVRDNIFPELGSNLADDTIGGDFSWEFIFTPNYLQQNSNYGYPEAPDPAVHAVRVLGLDAAFICHDDYEEWRKDAYNYGRIKLGSTENYARDSLTLYGMAAERLRLMRASRTMGIEFLLPAQEGKTSDAKDVTAEKRRVRLGAVPLWAGATAREQFRPLSDKGITDLNPFGTWRIAIDKHIHGPTGQTLLGKDMSGDGSTNNPKVLPTHGGNLSKITDIALMLRVAVRPRYPNPVDS